LAITTKLSNPFARLSGWPRPEAAPIVDWRSHAKDLEYGAALALANAGHARGAQALTDDLDKRYLSDTVVQFICLPAMRGRLAIDRKKYSKALEILQATASYELGYQATLTLSIYVAFVRSEAYLSRGQNGEAPAEFQKILSHRRLVGNEPIGAVVRGRATPR